MPEFTDNKGRKWEVSFNVSAIKRVRDRLGINLAQLVDNELAEFLRVAGDPVLLCDVLFVLCEGQHAASNIEFGEAMAGDSIEQAADAFYGAMVNFSHSRIRGALTALATKAEAAKTVQAKKAEEVTAKILEMSISSLLATSSPELSGLIPAVGPTVS